MTVHLNSTEAGPYSQMEIMQPFLISLSTAKLEINKLVPFYWYIKTLIYQEPFHKTNSKKLG